MDSFRYHRGELWCEQVPLERIAAEAGTPTYVYSLSALRLRYRRLAQAFRGVPCLLCFSVKANSNLTVLREVAGLGGGFDIVSGGELYRLQRAGCSARKVVFSGVGKTREEMDFALKSNVLLFNVESPAELDLLASRARRLRRRARVLVRVNPDVEAHTHPHISTGRQAHKFGVHWRETLAVCQQAAARPETKFLGIGCHIGSQIRRLAPFLKALRRLERLGLELEQMGLPVRYLDFGGGVGIRYQNEATLAYADYARAIKQVVRRLGCRLILEPGRTLVGPTGVLLTKVILEKRTRGQRFVVVDAGMNDFLRPALYGAAHGIAPVAQPGGRAKATRCEVVGPLCETADALGHNLRLPPLQPGSLLAVRDVGAYGFVLASNYNARPRPAEVVVRGKRFWVARRRESRQDLVRGEE